MTFLEQYGDVIEHGTWILVSSLLIAGSVLAFKSKRTKTAWALMMSSIVSAISLLLRVYLQLKIFSYSDYVEASDPPNNIDFVGLVKYMNYAYYTEILSNLIFAVVFVLFCFRISNLYKRNEELEFLTSEMEKRDSEK